MGITRREQEKGRGHKDPLFILLLLIGCIACLFSSVITISKSKIRTYESTHSVSVVTEQVCYM